VNGTDAQVVRIPVDNHEKSDRELLLELAARIDALAESHEKILTLVGEIKEQAGPTLEALAKSPIMRMMSGGK